MNFKRISRFASVIAVTASLLISNAAFAVRADGYNQGIVTFVTSLYSDCLGRTPDASGLNDWCSKLASGQITGKQCAYGFFFSPEFQANANAMSDDAFIEAYYRVFLNRNSDPNGRAYWAGQIANTTNDISVLFTGFADSTEFAQKCASYGITTGAHVNVPVTVRSSAPTPVSAAATNTMMADNWAANMNTFWYSYYSSDMSMGGYVSENYYITSEYTMEYCAAALDSRYNNYPVYYEVYYSPNADFSNRTFLYSATIVPKMYGDTGYYEFQFRSANGLFSGHYQFIGHDTSMTHTLFNVSAVVY